MPGTIESLVELDQSIRDIMQPMFGVMYRFGGDEERLEAARQDYAEQREVLAGRYDAVAEADRLQQVTLPTFGTALLIALATALLAARRMSRRVVAPLAEISMSPQFTPSWNSLVWSRARCRSSPHGSARGR